MSSRQVVRILLILLSLTTSNFLKGILCDDEEESLIKWSELSPPSFTLEPPSQVDFSNSTGTRIDCSALSSSTSSSSSITIRWVNSNGGSPVGQPANRLQRVLSNGSLIFDAFRAEDYNQGIHAATYRCLISNSLGTVVSRDVRVRAVVMQRYELQVYNEFVIQGNTAVFKCHIPSFVSDYIKVVSWIHDAGHYGSHTTIQNGDRYTIVPTGELHIQRVGSTDANYNYRCKSRHRLTGETRTSSTSGKLVITNPQGSVSPRITDSRSWVHVREGADAVLPCAAQGYPAPTYSWMVKNNRTSMEHVQLVNGRIRISGGNLLLSNTRKSDQGTYSCVVSNSVGNQTAETTLNVIAPLTVHIRPSEQVIGIGESATFLCGAHGHPVNHIAWYKDGKLLNEENTASKGQTADKYVIRSVQKRNQGVYQCVVRNDRDSAQGQAYLRLKDAVPELLEKFPSKTVSPGVSISLKCSASGNPPPLIQWSVDGDPVERMPDLAINQFVNQIGDVVGHLNISRITVEHSGNYKCTAKNRAGQLDHTARINVYGPLRIKEMKKMTVVAGESMMVTCRVIGFPFDTVTWEKEGMLLPANRRHRVHLNGTLTIQNVHQESDSGQYICVARAKDNAQGARGSVDVMVLVQPKIAPFTFQNSDLYEGMRVQVMCSVRQGDLPISIRWMKNGQLIQSSTHTGVAIRLFDGYTSSLSIQSVTSVHNGNYTCVASNAAAAVNFTAALNVKVSPKWLVAPSDVKLLSGKAVAVHCSAAGQPIPTISWMKADGDVPQQYSEVDFRNDPHLRIFSNGTLYIQDARERDQGYYLCQASNGVGGGLSKVVFIDVQVPAYFDVKFFNVSGKQGDNIKLVCDARGDVPINVKWRKKPLDSADELGSRFFASSSLNPNGVLAILEIKSSEKIDSGVYRCEGENQYGRDAAEVLLSVMGVPDSPKNVKVFDFTSRTADITWVQEDVRNHDDISYVIRHKTDSGEEKQNMFNVFNVSKNDQTIKAKLLELRPFTKYTVEVLTQNVIGISKASENVVFTTMEEAPREPPYDIKVEANEPYTLKITWKEPKSSYWHGELLGYNVGYRISGLGDPYVFRTTVNSYEDGYGQVVLRGLQSYTKYDIIIQAYNRLGAGPSSDVLTATTTEDVPQKSPENVNCIPTSSQSLQVSWQSIQNSRVNNAALRYRVDYFITNNETYFKDYKTTPSLEITLHGLEKYENYTILVTAISSVGDGVTSIPITCHTLEDVPSFPAAIKVVMLSSESLTVAWKPPHRTNGVVVKYTVYIREVDYGFDNMTKRVVNSEQHHYLVKTLKRNKRYEFWVTASTIIGEGQSTKMVSQVVNNKIPARIISFGSDIVATLKGSVELPCQLAGDPAPEIIWLYGGKNVVPDSRYHKNSNGNLVIKDLKASDSGDYICQVKNIHGNDRIEHNLKVQALPITATLSVVSTAFDSITVLLNDKLNVDYEENKMGYTMHYKREYGEWENRPIANNLGMFVLDELWCGTKYHLYITSNDKRGLGPSEVLISRTKGDEPTKPSKDKLIRTFKNYATLNLNAWDDNGCRILYFVVEYKISSEKEWNLVSNNIRLPKESIVLHDLQMETEYVLRVTAHNRAGSTVATYDFHTFAAQDRELSNPKDLSFTNNVPFYRDIKLVASVITGVSGLIIIVIVYVICTYMQRRMLERSQQESDSDIHKDIPDGCLVHDYCSNNVEAKLNYSNLDSKLVSGSVPGSSTLPIDHTKGYHEDITPYATYRIPEENNLRGYSTKVWYEVPSNQEN